MRARVFLWIAVLASAGGLFFASYSTFDFVQHLDRQVHGIHCSFIPGLTGTDVSGTSGCHVTLMSSYSSILRDQVWGGVPIALPAMAVFAFLLFYGLLIALKGRERHEPSTSFFALALLLPVLSSAVMGYISLHELGAACKLCIGIYSSSGLAFAAALGLRFFGTRKRRWDEEQDEDDPEDLSEPGAMAASPLNHFLISFLTGVLFVALSFVVYLGLAPDFSGYIGQCGELIKAEDPYGIMIPIDPHPGEVTTIEVFDPLCPSCKGFEKRLESSGLAARMDRHAVLFPLDSTCNWMVGTSLHPGACVVSEALLCAKDDLHEVIAWAFQNQSEIISASSEDPKATKKMIIESFPGLKGCIGSTKVRSRLNRSLRWAVANKLPVLTPQLYVAGEKLCDEDTDLGMDYALSRMLDAPAAAGGAR